MRPLDWRYSINGKMSLMLMPVTSDTVSMLTGFLLSPCLSAISLIVVITLSSAVVSTEAISVGIADCFLRDTIGYAHTDVSAKCSSFISSFYAVRSRMNVQRCDEVPH